MLLTIELYFTLNPADQDPPPTMHAGVDGPTDNYKLTASLAKVLQYFCNGHVEFSKHAHLSGQLTLETEVGIPVIFNVFERVEKVGKRHFGVTSKSWHALSQSQVKQEDINYQETSVLGAVQEEQQETESNTQVFSNSLPDLPITQALPNQKETSICTISSVFSCMPSTDQSSSIAVVKEEPVDHPENLSESAPSPKRRKYSPALKKQLVKKISGKTESFDSATDEAVSSFSTITETCCPSTSNEKKKSEAEKGGIGLEGKYLLSLSKH